MQNILHFFNFSLLCIYRFPNGDNPALTLAALKKIADEARKNSSGVSIRTKIESYKKNLMIFFQFLCSECGKKYTTEKFLKSHKKCEHSKILPQYAYPLPADQCTATCTTPYNLVHHMRDIHRISMTNEEAKKCFKPVKKTKSG